MKIFLIVLIACAASSQSFTIDFFRSRLSAAVNSAKKCYVGEKDKFTSMACNIGGTAACVTKLEIPKNKNSPAIISKEFMKKKECMELADKNDELCKNDNESKGKRTCYYCCYTDNCNEDFKIKIVTKGSSG